MSSAERAGIRVVDARIAYGRSLAVDGVGFGVPPGTALGLVGESGSGKTTLARAIAGQLPLAGGEILLDGDPLPARRSRAQLRAIQLVPQDPGSSLDPRMTVAATLGELLRAHRIVPRAEVRSRAAALLAQVRLDPALLDAFPHELSGGQRQRVAIARALALEPRVLVADEPTSALDVAVQVEVIALLDRLRRELGLALIFISHDLAAVHRLCDRIAVLRDGRLVELGGPDFFRAPRESYSRELLAAVPRLPEHR